MNKVLFFVVLGLLALAGGLYYSFPSLEKELSDDIKITETWELPEILEEISGIAYIGSNKIACVQDEDGIIFIYDLGKSSITDQIDFAGPGDYEGITLVGTTAYVLRSDGIIYEIRNFQNENKKTIEHSNLFESEYNFEGLGYDQENNRLLIALKEKSGNEFKPVYGFDLDSKERMEEPVMKIDFSDPVFKSLDQKINRKILRPSEITIHPETREFYILEGVDPKLLIMDPSGNPREIFRLNKKQFPQAEGLTFGNSGELYISNEGRGGKANILKVVIER